jgi:hypothetical protein
VYEHEARAYRNERDAAVAARRQLELAHAELTERTEALSALYVLPRVCACAQSGAALSYNSLLVVQPYSSLASFDLHARAFFSNADMATT